MVRNITKYNDLQKEIKFIVRSEVKLKILKELCGSDLSAKELSDKGINYGSISSNIKQLEKRNLITRIDDKYHIRNSVKKKIINLLYLNEIMNTVDLIEDYLNKHYVKNDKLKILEELPLSRNYERIHNTPLNPYKVVNNFTKNMTSEGEVKIIFTHVHPEFRKTTEIDSETQTEVKILVTEDIKNYLIENKCEHNENYLNNRTVKIKSIEPINLSLAISEKEVMFVLYNNDKTYDTNTAIISQDPKIIDWGKKLFNEIESSTTEEYIIMNNVN